jgi:hypothetical protein
MQRAALQLQTLPEDEDESAVNGKAQCLRGVGAAVGSFSGSSESGGF